MFCVTWSRVAVAACVFSLPACSDGQTDGDADDEGMPDAGSAGDAGFAPLTEPLDLGEPIDAPSTEWTWVDFPDTRCMDDSPSGLGIWDNPDSDKVLIQIQGGGACFNQSTCAIVANPTGFNEGSLADAVSSGIVSDADDTNPFAGWSKVFIPYCSGDNFTGAAVDGTGYEGRTQMGYLNIRSYLERLVPTFADKKEVVLTGYSAGGIAATMNSVQMLEAFGPDVRLSVLNDSGAMFSEEYLSPCMQGRLSELWHGEDNLPPDCTECDPANGHILDPLLEWAAPRIAHVRQGFISYDADFVIRAFMGFGVNDCASFDSAFAAPMAEDQFRSGLADIRERFAGRTESFAMYEIAGTGHVLTIQSPGSVQSEGVTLSDWLADFIDPDADFESVVVGQ